MIVFGKKILPCIHVIFLFSRLVKFTSFILGQNEKYHQVLESMVSAVTPNNSKWTRCYHAKTDGFTAHDFHSGCDNKGPTITLVQVREFVFGGFLDQNWGGKAKLHNLILHGSHDTTPRYGQYLTHVHGHITGAVAAMDSCFGLVRPPQHGIGWMVWSCRLKGCFASVSAVKGAKIRTFGFF